MGSHGKKYKVTYDWKDMYGEWKTDSLTNNGKGMDIEDAEYTACQLEVTSVCETADVRIE